MLPLFLLIGLVLINAAWVWRDRRDYPRFTAERDSGERCRTFRRWILESFLLYGACSVLVLAVLGRLPALATFPAELAPLVERLRAALQSGGFWGGFGSFVVALGPFLLLAQTVGALVRAHRQDAAADGTPDLRDIQALFPRNARERRWTGLLSLNAGLSEELFFRLAAPLLLYEVTGQLELSVLLSLVWFGLVHAYQGWVGIVSTTVIGAIMTLVYWLTGSIWIAVAVHAILDLNDLWLAPTYAAWRARSNAEA